MVDLTRDQQGRVRARLLDLVPGRSGKAYADWLEERGETFRAGVKVAALDPFQGYKTAIDDKLEDAVAVLDAFHIVKLGTHAVDEYDGDDWVRLCTVRDRVDPTRVFQANHSLD